MKKNDLEGRSKDLYLGLFKDSETDWVFRRTLAYVNEKAAEVGECMHLVHRINEIDIESWIQEWANLGGKVETHAEDSLSKGCELSAREAFLRATNYYRTAEYGTPPSHRNFDELWRKSVSCFNKASQLFNPPIQKLTISFEEYKLPGYFHRPDNSNITHPTLVAAGGNDTSLEEVYFLCGLAAIRRGYNFFAFEHPGHRGAVHLYSDCTKRPDYENPYAAAIDYLETLPGVDERIALTGFSFGGYIASRVAVYEKRLKAVIPNSPIIDLARIQTTYESSALARLILKLPSSLLNQFAEARLKKSPQKYALAKYNMWTMGYPDMQWSDFLQFAHNVYKHYTIEDELHKIICPALIMVSDSEGDELMRQAEKFHTGISSSTKKMHMFSFDKDGSNDHIQLDNRSRGNQVMFDWLDEVFDYRYEKIKGVL